jgi:hypothetical protein
MAVGLPLKTTYATGDVYQASDVNDTNGTINAFVTGGQTAGKNSIINGGMDVWQRGTSFTPASTTKVYTTDRWLSFRTATGMTITRQATGDTTNLPFIQYNARVQRDSGNTSTATPYFIQAIETVNTIPLAGKTITVSFYARRGANFSATSNLLKLQSFTGTGTDQDPTSFAYTGQVEAILQTFTLTTTWQRFSTTVTLGATVTEMDLVFSYNPTGTAGAADYYDLTGVQLEVGSTATPFSRAGGTIQGELAACQRYCWKATSDATDKTLSVGTYYNLTTFISTVSFPVTMRTSPSATFVNGTNYYIIYSNNTQDYCDTGAANALSTYAFSLEFTGNVSGTIGYGGQVRTNNASASIILSAEL